MERIAQLPSIRDVITSNSIIDMLAESDERDLQALRAALPPVSEQHDYEDACVAAVHAAFHPRVAHPISIPFSTQFSDRYHEFIGKEYLVEAPTMYIRGGDFTPEVVV